MSEEQKLKIGKSNKGKIRTTKFKENVGNFHKGRKRSEETKEKMSKAKLGK